MVGRTILVQWWNLARGERQTEAAVVISAGDGYAIVRTVRDAEVVIVKLAPQPTERSPK